MQHKHHNHKATQTHHTNTNRASPSHHTPPHCASPPPTSPPQIPLPYHLFLTHHSFPSPTQHFTLNHFPSISLFSPHLTLSYISHCSVPFLTTTTTTYPSIVQSGAAAAMVVEDGLWQMMGGWLAKPHVSQKFCIPRNRYSNLDHLCCSRYWCWLLVAQLCTCICFCCLPFLPCVTSP